MRIFLIFSLILICSILRGQCDASYSDYANDYYSVLHSDLPEDSTLNYSWILYDPETGPHVKYGYSLEFVYYESTNLDICLIVSSEACADTVCNNMEIMGGKINPNSAGCFTPLENQFRLDYISHDSIQFYSSIENTETNTFNLFWGDSLLSDEYDPIINFTQTGDYNLLMIITDSTSNCRRVFKYDFPIFDSIPARCNPRYTTISLGSGPEGDTIQIIPEAPAYLYNYSNVEFSMSLQCSAYSMQQGLGVFYSFSDTLLYAIAPAGVYEFCNYMTGGPIRCWGRTCKNVTIGDPEPNSYNLNVFIEPSFFTGFKLELFREDSISGAVELIDERVTSWNGTLVQLENLPNAYYFVRASREAFLPCFFPTYYGNQFQWQGSGIDLSFNQNFTIYLGNCQLIDTTGFGLVNGTFTLNDHRISSDTSEMNNRVYILLTNEDNDVISYRKPLNNGEFSFSGLHPGNYIVYAEYPGWEVDPYYFNISAENSTEVINISYLGGITNAENSIIDLAANIKVYPNPGNSTLNVISEEAAQLRIYNLSGMVLVDQTLTASSLNSLAVDNLSSGLYLLQINVGDSSPRFFRWIKN